MTFDTNDTVADQRTRDESDGAEPELELLIVGTFGGGGIHQYVDEYRYRLGSHIAVSVHDMRMPTGDGIVRVVRGVLAGLFAFLRFAWLRRPDVVHLHTSQDLSFYRAGLYALYARYIWKRPVVLHVHGSSFDEFLESAPLPVALFQSAVFGSVTDVIVLSEYWASVLAERVPQSKIRVLPNAVDTDSFPVEIDTEQPRIVFVSNLIERKGVNELVTASEELLERTDEPVEIDIAGDGPLSGSVERLADEHEAVEYHGYVSEKHKAELLAEGTIYVLPTYAEGLPIAMLEGMAAGNAVVSTPVGAIPEVIGEENGYLVPPGDADALADALLELVSDPERRSMAETNRRVAEERYGWDTILEELETLYAARAAEVSGD